MLVDVVESLPEREEGGVVIMDDAGIERALRSFSAAIDSEDSLFQCDSVITFQSIVPVSVVCRSIVAGAGTVPDA